jgi:hypothetical protein
MANEIKIIRLDDRTLDAITGLAKELNKFQEQIRPFITVLQNASRFELAEFTGEELTAIIDGEEYVSNL